METLLLHRRGIAPLDLYITIIIIIILIIILIMKIRLKIVALYRGVHHLRKPPHLKDKIIWKEMRIINYKMIKKKMDSNSWS